MVGYYQSDYNDLIIEALIELKQGSQRQIERWIFKNPETADKLGDKFATEKKINSWVGSYLHRLRVKGSIEAVGVTADVQKGHKPGRIWALVPGVCPYCGRQPPKRKPALERL